MEYIKQRNKYLLEANLLSRTQHFFDVSIRQELSDHVRRLSLSYRTEVQSKVIVLENVTDGSLLKIPYTTRFDDHYIKKQLSRMRDWFNYQTDVLKRNHGKFLTLTLDPSNFMSVRDGYKQGQKKINSFLTRLRALFPSLAYIMVKEIQEKNTKNVHWHIMLLGVDDLSDDFLNTYWGLGFWKIENVDNNYKNTKRGLFRYLKKYLEKSLEENPVKPNGTLYWLWAMMIRSFSFSRIPRWYHSDDNNPELDKGKNNSNDFLEMVSDFFPQWIYLGTFRSDLPWGDINTRDDLLYALRS
jgi:hypothetical protein